MGFVDPCSVVFFKNKIQTVLVNGWTVEYQINASIYEMLQTLACTAVVKYNEMHIQSVLKCWPDLIC